MFNYSKTRYYVFATNKKILFKSKYQFNLGVHFIFSNNNKDAFNLSL